MPVIYQIPPVAADAVAALPYPAVFATISGSHMYGFASADSDLDIRAVHRLPLEEVIGLRTGPETLQSSRTRDGVELDVVSQELAKFCRLLLRPNGHILEQVLSPLVVTTSDLHAELVALAPGCVTRYHSHHYLGFAKGQWQLFEREGSVKPALYTLRVLLTGIHLMRTGELECDLPTLAPGMDLPYVPDLIERKARAEKEPLGSDTALRRQLESDVQRLQRTLEQARDETKLPDRPGSGEALHHLVVQARLS
ncbi:nucleotidyltransferase domain-containing protein [Virgisporangium ochraceum]|uniref:Nucleotidyltransferase n=1 Tax=Virgisporangium ochraceum TaxID=65505 RepID=A0A8J4EG18_9ACTN|nr:nucleotidyltransferase [Virgisporangium ochraceum]